MYGRVRVGILYRSAGRIASVRWPVVTTAWAESQWPEWPMGPNGEVEEVRAWIEKETGIAARDWDIDTSYLGHFYRALEEETEFYVLWEAGVGWRAGGTTWDTEIRGKLLPWADVVTILESWYDHLKNTVNGGNSHGSSPGFEYS